MEPVTDPAAMIGTLSQRELQVLRLSGEGKSTDQIAYLMAIAPVTAQHDRAAGYDKLGLTALTPAARLQQLARLHDADGAVPAAAARPAGGAPATPIEPSPAALAAVAADDRLLGQGTVPGTVVGEQRTVRFQPVEPATAVAGSRPILPWGLGGGPGVMLAVLAVALVLGAVLVFLFLRASQPAPVAQPAVIATAVPPAAQNAAPPPPPATPAPAPATPAAAAPAPIASAPPLSEPAAAAPAAGSAPVPAAVAPAVPQPSSAPVAIAAPAPAAANAPAAGAAGAGNTSAAAAPATSGLPDLAPLAIATPFPMPAAQTTTPPNSVLTLGQTWSQNGLNLTLVDARATTAGIALNFVLSSGRPSPVSVNLSRSQIFSATDSAGIPLTLVDPAYRYSLVLQPNTAAVFDAAHSGGPILFSGNLGGTSLTSVTVTVTGLAPIGSARWRLVLQH